MNDEACALYDNDRLVARWTVGVRGCRIGSDPSCDVRVEFVPHHLTWLVRREHGSVFLHTVHRESEGAQPTAERRHLPLAKRVPLHGALRLVREDPRGKRGCERENVSNRCSPSGIATLSKLAAASGVARTRRNAPTARVLGIGPDSRGCTSIQVGSGPDARRYQFAQETLTIGSDPHAHVTLQDPLVDRHHCMMERAGGEVWLRDLGSRHGTFVNEVRVGVARLQPGVRVRLGRSTLSLVDPDHATTSESEAAGPVWIAASNAMQRIREQVARYAPLSWPVLITGETGVGKELVAQHLHRLSGRDRRPLVSINAGALSPTLLDSELFGHEKGAFTGAQHARAGVFEQAHDGTLFLDEIGELPIDQQTRLLRVLETGEVRRVGAEKTRRVDVRLVCATHRDLRQHPGYRADLLYRMSRLWIHIPPLAERPEDIVALTHHFLQELSNETLCRGIHAAAMTRLLGHSWPGNTRELRNVLSTAAVHCQNDSLHVGDIDRALRHTLRPIRAAQDTIACKDLPSYPPTAFRSVLQIHDGNVSAAARSLGIPRSTLRDRIRRCTAPSCLPTEPPYPPVSGTHHGRDRPVVFSESARDSSLRIE